MGKIVRIQVNGMTIIPESDSSRASRASMRALVQEAATRARQANTELGEGDSGRRSSTDQNAPSR